MKEASNKRTNTIYEVPRRVIVIQTESRIKVARARRGGNGKLVFSRYRISVGEDEKVLEMSGGDDAHQMNLRPQNCTLKVG